MGKKDAVSKHYMSKNEIFADAVNFYFFDGKEKVKPEDLEAGDPEELELFYGKHAAVSGYSKAVRDPRMWQVGICDLWDRNPVGDSLRDAGQIHAVRCPQLCRTGFGDRGWTRERSKSR